MSLSNILNIRDKNKFHHSIKTNDKNYLIEIDDKPKQHFIIDEINFATKLVEMQKVYKTEATKRSKLKKLIFSFILGSFFWAKHKFVNKYCFLFNFKTIYVLLNFFCLYL